MSRFTGDPNSYLVFYFATGVTGTCLCKLITITLNDPDLFTQRRGRLCHYVNCRKLTGSFALNSLLIDEDKVTIIDRQKIWIQIQEVASRLSAT
jgi:hypothetical protein